MANHKSAKKRAKQSEVKRLRNRSVKSQVKTAVTKLRTLVATDVDGAATTLKAAASTIAKAAKKGVLHKNTAARKISRLARLVNKAKA